MRQVALELALEELDLGARELKATQILVRRDRALAMIRIRCWTWSKAGPYRTAWAVGRRCRPTIPVADTARTRRRAVADMRTARP
jgi:hypothetical protein